MIILIGECNMQTFQHKNRSDKKTEKLLQVVHTLVTEVHAQHFPAERITLDSSFDKDLELDSLSRVELIARVETAFNLALPERIYVEAETPRDLLRTLLGTEVSYMSRTASEISTPEMGETVAAATEAQTLMEVLRWHVARHPDRPHIQLYRDDGNGKVITYAELEAGAEKVAAVLQQHKLKAAEPVAIMLPTGADYFFSFFGILMAGGIPVPIYPPARPSKLEDHMRRHAAILDNCRATILITVPEAKHVAQLLKSLVPNLKEIISVSELKKSSAEAIFPTLHALDTAFLQYTSGSTGTPKGVVLTHANLLTNIRAMGEVVDAGSEDVFVSWLPLYHDMGLIGAWLGSLYFASLFVVMSPLDFLSKPERWLWAIHRYRGTLSASPNFGYEYSLHRLKNSDLSGLDLSSWRAAFNGAEAVSPETLEQFNKHFKAYGFDEKSMMPVYGLAESSVGLAFPPMKRGVRIDRIDRDTFTRSGRAVPVKEDESNALKFVSNGLPIPGHQIRIADPSGQELPERQQGRLEFCGPSSTSGYYRDAEKTQHLFNGKWLDTGDLAYIAKGELYLTGRIKDIIIRAGRNIYPDELEKAVGNVPGIRKGCVAVFGSMDQKTQTEQLIVLAETQSDDPDTCHTIYNKINTLSVDLTSIPPDKIVLAAPGSVLKTSSGKIRRAACRELFEKDLIGKGSKSVPLQVIRLALDGIIPRLRRTKQYLGTLFFAAYSWTILALIAPIVWISVALLPKFSMRWDVMRRSAQVLAYATGTGIKIKGIENLPTDGRACVLVANHASYLDGYALLAALPGYFRFVAKAELSQTFITRIPLKNIHTEFVERFDISKSVHDAEHLQTVLDAGHTLLFFPEGSFSRVPGLMSFHLGAFSVAAQAGVPVVPIAIRGTRSILRAESWLPYRGAITIEIAKPVDPKKIAAGTDKKQWDVAIELRNQSRELIQRHCGEPDLS